MSKILTFEKPADFFNTNKKFIFNNYFSHYHLIKEIEDICSQRADLNECYNIEDDNGSFVLCMRTSNAFFIYGTSWTNEIVSKLSEKVGLDKYETIVFIGQRDLIQQLFDSNQTEAKFLSKKWSVDECEIVKQHNVNLVGKIETADMDDFEELVEMSWDYVQEEFNGKSNQTKDSISSTVTSLILKSSLFVWKANGVITTFARLIGDRTDFAFIGGFYTKEDFRRKGYGYAFMYSLTNELLKNGYSKCGVLIDTEYQITKKIFERIGYTSVYNFGKIAKYKGEI